MPILGIDEVGRGPWAGPLVIGAAVLPERFDENNNPIEQQTWQDDLADSKKLTPKRRERLSPIILENAKATGLGWIPAKELDQIGLSNALKLATRRAVCELLKLDQKENEENLKNIDLNNLPFDEIIIDGTMNFLKDTPLENMVTFMPKADAKIKEVSAASIIAKVARDDYMKNLAEKYPQYGFEKHVGYGTAAHKAALEKYGPCDEHRISFKPVAHIADFEGSSRQRERTKGNKSGAKMSARGDTFERAPSDTLRESERGDGNENVAGPLAPTTTATGSRAEQVVANYLKQNGHKILARNYKTKFYEIDIVSADKNHIYFTEVKYRKNKSHGAPLEFIDKKKQEKITFAANAFMKTLSEKLNRSQEDLPSPILAGASVTGPDFNLEKWLEIMV